MAGYTLRQVDSPNAFREKISILERGLQDGAVEVMKLLLAMQLQRTMDLVDLVFHTLDERTGALRFVAVLSDGAEQYVTMQGETYTAIARDISERLFLQARDFIKVDIDWATQALELLQEASV